MKLVQFTHPASGPKGPRLGLVSSTSVIDLTATPSAPGSLYDLYYNHGGNRVGLEAAVDRLNITGAPALELADLLHELVPAEGARLLRPVSPPVGDPHRLRIWLAGVTHADSAKLREIEARQATGESVNVYDQKYRECQDGGIPELFAKTDPDALVGPGEPAIRPQDTMRLVPETELVTVYGLNPDGQVERLGYTGGNDYTDNGIEATNPLNLPQAKNWYGGCASLGPVFITDSAFDDSEVTVSCEVVRKGERVAYKEGKTGQRHLNMPDGLFHLERSLFNRLPLPDDTLQLLYWGTPIVFAEGDLADGLQDGDLVRMAFSGGIGPLANPVVAGSIPDQLTLLSRSN